MKKINLFSIFLISINTLISQSFTVQSNSISPTGLASDNDFYLNTYLDANSNSSLTWSIVYDSMPSNWEFSICFPMCNPIGLTNGTLNISSGQSYYLNCHFYPHNTVGEGYVTMEITDSVTSELVTWHGITGSVGIVNNWYDTNNKSIKAIYDLNGKIVDRFTSNNIYIVIFEDNTSGKIFINEQ